MAKITAGVVYIAKDGQAVQCSCDITSEEFMIGSIPRASQLRDMLKDIRAQALLDENPKALLGRIAQRIDQFLHVPDETPVPVIGKGSFGEDMENMVHNVIQVGRKYDADLGKARILKPNAAQVAAAERSKK